MQWLAIQKIQWLRNKKQEWKVECQQNAVNGKISGDYSEWEMWKGSGRLGVTVNGMMWMRRCICRTQWNWKENWKKAAGECQHNTLNGKVSGEKSGKKSEKRDRKWCPEVTGKGKVRKRVEREVESFNWKVSGEERKNASGESALWELHTSGSMLHENWTLGKE